MRLLLLAALVAGLALPARAQDPLGGLAYSNDDIAFAFPLSPDAPAALRTVSTVNATADPLVTEPAASCQSQANTKSVWWVIRANTTAPTVTIDLTGSDFDTVLSVYTYNGSALTQVACNDDISGSVVQSRISNLALTTGFEYYVRVAGYQTQAGTVQLALTSTVPFVPLYNEYIPRNTITAINRPGARLASNLGASQTIPGEPTAPASCSTAPGSYALWYRYNPTQTGFLTLDTVGSEYDTILLVTSLSGTVLACNDDITGSTSTQSRIRDLPVTAGTSLYVRISNFTSSQGVLRFNTSFSTTATAGEGDAPDAGVALRAPAPNPTTGRAALAFTLDAAGPARLSVVDALGREVAVLFDGPAAAGETTATFDGTALPAGVYAARLSAGGRVETQRVTVVR